MENPHDAAQSLLLARISQNVAKCNEAFKAIADESQGRVPGITWKFNEF